jgi:membrane protein YdbS with pleckstrin-like domain
MTVYGGIKGRILRLLRVPPEPPDPGGAPGSLLVFRAAPNFYRYLLLRWLLRQSIALWGAFAGLAAFHGFVADEVGIPWLAALLYVSEVAGIGLVLVQTVFSYLMVRLDYELRWYKVTDRSLRIREGIWSVREMTMTFANIQNISVSRGPLQRLLGIADVEVQSAGGGGGGGKESRGTAVQMHRGLFRGVDNAEEIRDRLRDRLRSYRDSGLGDTAAPRVLEPSTDDEPADELAGVLTELLAEARGLRIAAQASGGGRE